MKIAILALALAGCMTPMTYEQRAAQMQAQFGPMCQAAGLKPATPDYSACMLSLYQQDQAARQQAAMAIAASNKPAPLTVYQMPTRPAITCNTVLGTTTCR